MRDGISETAQADIVRTHGGREWAELVDITLPSGYNPSTDEAKWMATAPDGRKHILVTNAAAPVCMKATGWQTWSYTPGYNVYFNVPYTRDEIEDANESSNGLVKTRITLGDTSGTVKAVMDKTNGLCGLSVNIAWAMVAGHGADAVRDLLDEDDLTDAEAECLLATISGATYSSTPALSIAAKETGGAVFAVIAYLPATDVYSMIAGYRPDDIVYADRATAMYLATGLDGVSTDFDVLAKGTADGVYVRKGGGANVKYMKLAGVTDGGSVEAREVPAMPSGGSLSWFAITQELVTAMQAISGEVSGLPAGCVFARSPDLEYKFVSGESAHDRKGFAFQLSTKNPLAWRFPPRTIYKAACQWVFKSPECGYTGNATSCRKTIAACRALNNIARIGCFPGCGSGGLAQ